MGHSLSWTAVRGKAPDLLLKEFRLRRTAGKWDLPDRRHPLCRTTLDDGWSLVLSSPRASLDTEKAFTAKRATGLSPHARLFDPEETADEFLSALSVGCEVVCCFVEETVMVSRAAAWKDGVRLWSVLHDPNAGGLDHLQVVGQPPSSLAAMRAAASRRSQSGGEGPQRGSPSRRLVGAFVSAFFGMKPRMRTSLPGRGGRPARVDHMFEVPVELAKELTGFRHDEVELEFELLEPDADQ